MNNSLLYKSLSISIALLCSLGCTAAETKITSTKSTDQNELSTQKDVSIHDPTPTPIPTCDGVAVTSGCQVNGVMYSTYIYHPAVPEKSHIEKSTTSEQVVSGYCTLCVDGSYSPSCATGRGACSHHGGVQEWNAPRYRTETHTTETIVIDQEAVAAYYETVEQ